MYKPGGLLFLVTIFDLAEGCSVEHVHFIIDKPVFGQLVLHRCIKNQFKKFDRSGASGLKMEDGMYCNSMSGRWAGDQLRGFREGILAALRTGLVVCFAIALILGGRLNAQLGEGGIQGTITDPSGALIRKAKVSATNVDTGVATLRSTNGSGEYSLSPLPAGNYQVEVVAKGFQRLLQEDVKIDALTILGLNLKLSVGSDAVTVTVTSAPPMLDTEDASLGGTIENDLYAELPLSMGGNPRDPTAFVYLMPGVQEDTGSSTGTSTTGIYGGTGQTNLNENYVDGVPVTNISAQGDSTPIKNAVSVDAVDQFQVKTNGANVGFGGAGVTNYTLKAGGNTFHGTVFDYIRNTMFDSWGYFSKVPAANGFAVKPGEHQNSYGGSLGGPILKDKLFFFGTYEGFHYTKISNTPQYLTIPTLRERVGDFTDMFGTQNANNGVVGVVGIFDPTESSNRPQFQGLLNGVPTYNVIPTGEISSISQYLQSALPAPTNSSTINNYLAGLPLENDDYTIDVRLDYTLGPRNRISITGVGGLHGFGSEPNYHNLNQIPFPYAQGSFTAQKTASGVVTYIFIATQSLINSFKYGYSRTWGNSFSPTDNTKWGAAAAGIGNLPLGNAQNTFPGVGFSGGSGTAGPSPTGWASNVDSGPVATNTFTAIDNLVWTHGRHNTTVGAQVQWLETNAASYGGYSGGLALTFNGYDTQNLAPSLCKGCGTGGAAYASFLVGAVYSSTARTQRIVDVGGRFRPMAPYIEDSWRATSKLTLDLGIRYDYLQPYHEAKNRISFINPTIVNPIVGIPGVVMIGGYGDGPNPSYAGYVCQCRAPVRPYNKNFEPRLGAVYALHKNIVFRANFGIMTTHAGGTGGRAGATTGTGNNSEFASITSWAQSGSTGIPAYFLNPGIPGAPANSVYAPGCSGCQPDFSSVPVWIAAGNNLNPLGTTGNYNIPTTGPYVGVCANATAGYCGTQTQIYADPYYGGRGPQFVNYNFGIEQMLNKKAVLSINYAGSQTHFLPGGAGRGYATNGISPDYIAQFANSTACGSPVAGTNFTGCAGLLPSGLTTANLPVVQSILPGFNTPYSSFSGPNATVSKALAPFPQFGNLTDLWGQTGNSNYNALQIGVIQRAFHNISGFANFTWSKSIDDTGAHRSQFPIGPQNGNFVRNYSAGRVDRSLGTYNQPYAFNLTWVWTLPFGRGQMFLANNKIGAAIAGGWALSGIYKWRHGTPLGISIGDGASCLAATDGGQGTCFPDAIPGVTSARINGKWGRAPGANAQTIQNTSYINVNDFQYPDNNANTVKIGNIARSAPYGLYGPGWWDLDLGIRRTFSVVERGTMHVTFEVEGDVINSTNSTFFTLSPTATQYNPNACAAGVAATVSNCGQLGFGTVGGQNNNVPPRDWQLAGRLRF
jgi:hypothetical protein